MRFAIAQVIPSIFGVLLWLFSLQPWTISANVVNPAVDSSASSKEVIVVPMESNVIPNGYFVYEIPHFAIWFNTSNALTGDPELDAALLESEIPPEIKTIVGSFIKNVFVLEIAKLEKEEPHTTPPMIFNFVSVDFQVTIRHRSVYQDLERRHLTSSSSPSGGKKLLQFYAEFVGVAYFIVPAKGDKGADGGDPDSEEVHVLDKRYMHDLMLGWMNHGLKESTAIIEGFENSPTPLLSNIQSLNVVTDIVTSGQSPFDTETQEESGESAGKNWGQTVLTTLIIVVCISLLGMCAFLFQHSLPYIIPLFQNHSIDSTHYNSGPMAAVFPIHQYQNRSGSELHHSDNAISPGRAGEVGSDHTKNEPLPGRHRDADEDLLIREESDRWLKEHRPDLYEAVKKSSAGAGNAQDSQQQRRSLPMQFLLGGLFKSQEGNPNPVAPAEVPSPNPADISILMENQDLEVVYSDGSGPMQGSPNWWGTIIQGLKGGTLACEEDPTNYSFAFQDFPRHDGTPCLIYSETGDDTESNSMGGIHSNYDERPLSPTDPLSNEEFKRVLSLNGEESFEVQELGGGEEEEEDVEIIFDSSASKSSKFTDKLERMVAMRHRHYERQNLLDKHKKTREQRVHEESLQRELKLRRHEMELDMNEIEGQLTPRAITRRDRESSELARSSSNSPTDLAREYGSSASIALGDGTNRISHHRITASDPDVCSSSPMCSNGGLAMSNRLDYIATINSSNPESPLRCPQVLGESNNNDAATSTKQPKATLPDDSATRDSIHPSGTSVASKTLQKAKLGRRRSHRRWSSYGTESTDTNIKKRASADFMDNGRPRIHAQQQPSNDEDVMTFGIAAYTDFV